MSRVATAKASQCLKPLASSDLCHVVCCDDGDVSLCGLDMSDVDWGESDDICVVCDDLTDVGPDCPDGCPFKAVTS